MISMAFVRKVKRTEIVCVKKGRKKKAGRSRKADKSKCTFLVKPFHDSGLVSVGRFIIFPKSKIGKRVQIVVRYCDE